NGRLGDLLEGEQRIARDQAERALRLRLLSGMPERIERAEPCERIGIAIGRRIAVLAGRGGKEVGDLRSVPGGAAQEAGDILVVSRAERLAGVLRHRMGAYSAKSRH